ncbi:hypothetical protein [Streptococcus sp. DTU_2020_1000888_1_SI_GRL_NUU_041A]|uniref:hypothetical protein n=1 Tax=Streptococcus sp. DTU_2020_1000888_1_SI_GRL_NUU_041A TaxID=3077723 RepID=UPI0028E8D190|nr:hypothetical protein [Streptococcus sp. DTU_2020_1000888_1_SI_GRL_NUU_041A]WNU96075.1 hypothetical protein RSK81_12595 [Streptococcus sp. DTU_2020_1000888_1_SI_GRL_NUU_041A]
MKKQMQTSVSLAKANEFEEKARIVGGSPSVLLGVLVSNFVDSPYELSIDFSKTALNKEDIKTLTTTIDKNIADKFAERAAEVNQSISNLLRLLIIDFINNKKNITLYFDKENNNKYE